MAPEPSRIAVPSLASALAFEAEEVVLRFQRETRLPLEDSHLLFQECKRWLWSCARREEDEAQGRPVPPSLLITPELAAIDRMWHAFLMFTREYHRFCIEHLGRYIHHVPLTQAELDRFEKLRAENPRAALEERRAELKPQLDYLYDLLGPQVIRLWYQDLPKRFAGL